MTNSDTVRKDNNKRVCDYSAGFYTCGDKRKFPNTDWSCFLVKEALACQVLSSSIRSSTQAGGTSRVEATELREFQDKSLL